MQVDDLKTKDQKSRELVSNWMTANPFTVQPQQTVREAIAIIQAYRIGYLPVVDEENRVQGLLTTARLVTSLLEGAAPDWFVANVMKQPVVTIGENEYIEKASKIPVGCLPVLNETGKLAGILTKTDILNSYKFQLEKMKESLHSAEILNTILESAYEGIVVTNENAIIIEINDAYCRIVGKQRDEVIGTPVTEIIENTRLHIVLQTGVAEKGYIQRIHGHDMVVHRIPIWKDGRVIGAIGMLIFEGVKDLYSILERSQVLSRQRTEDNQAAKRKDAITSSIDQILGQSEEIERVKRMARKAARTPSTVLITGESGTGKEMFAKAIHELSTYSKGEFISVNCAAIPEHLLEAELFGYEDGAFTGAKKGGKPGKFELAHKGTIFLDEIGDMPPLMQSKILRVLQEKEVERVGGVVKHFVDVRIIAATNRSLESMVQDGTFREDLYYRLNIIRLQIPPLRERRKDIPMLLQHHLFQICKKFTIEPKTLSDGALAMLRNYSWPGNVRELQNTVEMLVSLAESNVILADELSEKFTKNVYVNDSLSPKKARMKDAVLEKEKELIIKTLLETSGNKAAAARKLGIRRSTLYEKLKKHGIANDCPIKQT
ncbi:sigma 54-interacting transcriptional regulator [Neobacillus sp. SM06]|uniref:sigma 54-interacting transcriptional regulator n=1 Tax=Neobacillus sp. SM06 TaxID=3422492 RepID=UPI003D2BAC75